MLGFAPLSTVPISAAPAQGTASAHVSAPSPLGAAALYGVLGEVAEGLIAVPGPLGSPVIVGEIVLAGRAAGASPLGAPALRGVAVVAGRAAAPSPLAAGAVVGTVLRFELRGEVRDQGVLVNRRVRAYRRSTGALVAEADTVVGKFRLPVGFTADEFYIVPINLDAAATDFAPPCANREVSVLAMDVPA